MNPVGKCKINVHASFIAFDMVDSQYRFVKSHHELYLQGFLFIIQIYLVDSNLYQVI